MGWRSRGLSWRHAGVRACREGGGIMRRLRHRGRMSADSGVLARIELTAALGAQFGVLAGCCAHVDVAGAGSSVKFRTRDVLVLRRIFEGC